MNYLRPFAVVLAVSTVALAALHCSPSNEDDTTDVGDTKSVELDRDAEPPHDDNCKASEIPDLTTSTLVEGDEVKNAVHMTQAPGNSEAFFIVRRHGKIVVYEGGSIRNEPFLDLSKGLQSSYGEQGLLGLAFHPNYQDNRRFFVDYTPKNPLKNVVAEYRRSKSKKYRADPKEVRRLVDVDDPRKQHNGGTLVFGPDGSLYATLGNGGAKQKRKQDVGRAQLNDQVFGTIMRMDVDRPKANFAVPDNPFADGGGDGRILAWGLRNAWRIAFDAKTGDLYLGDVGKKSIEEIDYIPAGSNGGQNFGWPAYLGTTEGPVSSAKKAIDEHEEPIYEYQYRSQKPDIRGGCAVIGGTVYRGGAIPALNGYYVYGDLCSQDLAAIRYCDTKDADAEPEIVDSLRLPAIRGPKALKAIVADHDGELYLLGKKKIVRIEKAN